MKTEPLHQESHFEGGKSSVSQASHTIERSPTARKRVRFSSVAVRLHNVVCTGFASQGPSIGLDWVSIQKEPVSLNDYEETARTRRKSKDALKLCPIQRSKLLVDGFGYNPKDLRKVCQRRIQSTPRRTTASTQYHQQRSSAEGIRHSAKFFGSARIMMPRSLL